MKSYSEISNRYMKENKKRTILTIFGITLAAILIFAIGTFLYSLRDSAIKAERQYGDYEFILCSITKSQVEKVKNNVEIKNSSLCEDGKEYLLENSNKKVFMENGNKDYYSKIKHSKLLEGKYPSKQGEVMLNSLDKEKLNVNVGDKIKLIDSDGNKEVVTISGISEIEGYVSGADINLEGYLEKLSKDKNYSLYVNLKSNNNKQNIIKNVMKKAGIKVSSKTKQDHSEILYLTGNGGNIYITSNLRNIIIFVIAVIVISTITVIYNSFNISIIERIRYFGILKAIGATNTQIKKIIYKEGFLMGLIAMPLGCIIGFLALKFGVEIFVNNTFMTMELNIKFYPIVILLTAVVVFLTILLSLIIPVRKVKKISAVEAIRSSKEIKIGKVKRRKNRVISKIFGIEGSMAYKNIRRTPARFFITLIALTLSIVMFNIFYCLMDFSKQFISQSTLDCPFDSQLSKVDSSEFSDDELNIYTNLKYAKTSYKLYCKDISTIINEKYLTGKPLKGDLYKKYGYGNVSTSIQVGEGKNELNFYKKYITEGSLDYDKLNNGGVILVDGRMTTNKNGKKEIVRVTNYKVGDKIKVTNSTGDDLDKDSFNKYLENNSYEATIVAIVNKDALKGAYCNGNQIKLAFTKEGYEKLNNKINYNFIGYKFKNQKNENEGIKYFDERINKDSLTYVDMGQMLDEINGIYNQIEFFVYCFIIIITVIAIVNIFNTISTNLLLRKKEFATLKAIGMTEKQLAKTVILEGTLYGIISAIVGGIISFALSYLLVNMGGALADAEYKFNYIVFILSMLAAVLVTYLSTILPLKKLKKLTVVEGIRDDE